MTSRADQMKKAPGLVRRKRGDKVVLYWACRSDIAKAGYPLKTCRLWSGSGSPTPEESATIGVKCRQLQHEMFDWVWRPQVKKKLRVKELAGFIYFAKSSRMIKIGFATNPKRRLAHLQAGSPIDIELLGTMPGSPRLEKQLHHKFRELRLRGEWFKSGKPLLDFIEKSVR